MSKIDRTYFKWDEELIPLDIKLGDSKESLMGRGLIEEIENEGEIDYTGVNGTPWRVNFDKDKVSRIWFNRDSSFRINETELSGENYEKIKPILESNFQSLNLEIKNVEEMKSYSDSNVLYIICRDFFITMIGIIKTKPNKS
jgi:hypothetical protein